MRKLLVLLCLVPCVACAASSVTVPSAMSTASHASNVPDLPAKSAASSTDSNLFPKSSSDWAAWVQAIGSIGAIGAAAYIAIWQSKKGLHLMIQQKEMQDEEKVKTFSHIVSASARLQKRFADRLDSPHAVILAAKERNLLLPEVLALERALDRVELHLLPSELVTPAITLASTFTKFRILLENGLESVGVLSGSDFRAFHNEMMELRETLKVMDWIVGEQLAMRLPSQGSGQQHRE